MRLCPLLGTKRAKRSKDVFTECVTNWKFTFSKHNKRNVLKTCTLSFTCFWLIGLKSQWAYLIINHKLCTICLWTHSDGAHGGRYTLPLPIPTHPYPYLLPPTPTPTYPYPYLPLPPPTPTTNNCLERSQFINNVKHGLERSQFINNVKHGLERSQWSQMSRSRRWIQTPPTPTTPHPRNTQLDLSSRNSNGSKRITVQMNSHKHTLNLTVFLYLLSTSALISFKPS